MNAFDNDLLRTLRGERTERVPFWEVWFMRDGLLCRQILGEPADTVEKEIALAQRLGWQHLRIGGVDAGLPRTYRSVGDGTERYSPEGALHSLDQLEEIPPLDVDYLTHHVAARVDAAHEHGLAAIAYLPWCFHAVATSMGLLNFAYKTVDDIDFLHAALEFVEERNRVAIREVLVPLGVDAVLFDGDCAYRNGLMVSPRIFRELTHNRTAATVALLRQAGIPYVFHSDGQLDDVIPMLVELDFSAVHGIEALANDLSDIKRRFGRAITLIGNMDITFLGMSSVEQVREATRRMLDIGAPGGRYVAACNTSPEDFIPVENYSAFVEEIHAYAG
jgi:hypothetical protein